MYRTLTNLIFFSPGFVLVLLGGVFWSGAPAVAAEPRTSAPLAQSTVKLGVQSCTAAACHGSLQVNSHPDEIRFDEVDVWFNDPHAKAYQVLFEPRSDHMLIQLGVKDAEGRITNVAMFQKYWQQCLACHDPSLFGKPMNLVVGSRNPVVRGEGVGCEACHGGAREWLTRHYHQDWKKLTASQKAEYGFAPTGSVTGRAQICGSCHVGDVDREVNHDLIAAGHPAMKFELVWYESRLPPHWNSRRKLDQEEALDKWLQGQLVGAELSLKQLQRRAESDLQPQENSITCWPEFAEYRCFACHHELIGKDNPQQKIASFPYEPWEMVLIPDLARSFPSPESERFQEAFGKLAGLMDGSLGVNSQKVEKFIPPTLEALRLWQNSIDATPQQIAEAIQAISGQQRFTIWEKDAQVFLALAAPQRAKRTLPESELERLRELLAFPTVQSRKFDSPHNYLGSYEIEPSASGEDWPAVRRDLLQKLSQDLIHNASGK